MKKFYTTIFILTFMAISGFILAPVGGKSLGNSAYALSIDGGAAEADECKCPTGTHTVETDDKGRPIGHSTINWCKQKVMKKDGEGNTTKTYHCFVQKTTHIGNSSSTSWHHVGDTGKTSSTAAKKECKKMNAANCKMCKSCPIHKNTF